MTFHYVRRNDGSVIDIPDRDLVSTLKRNPGWSVMKDEPKKEVTVEGYPCPVCEFIAASSFGLQAHKRGKHK